MYSMVLELFIGFSFKPKGEAGISLQVEDHLRTNIPELPIQCVTVKINFRTAWNGRIIMVIHRRYRDI
jgi:hypothetical protein